MIKSLPYLKTNLNAIFNNYKTNCLHPLYKTILDNYSGKDYKSLETYASTNKEKNILLFGNEEWVLYMQLIEPHRTFHYYNNTIIKHLDGGNIRKSSVGDQVFQVIKKQDIYNVCKPTIIQNFDYVRASCLIFKFNCSNPYKKRKIHII